METMGHLLRMATHTKRPKMHQRPDTLCTDLHSQGPYRRPCGQPQAYPQKNPVAIHLLRGTYIYGRGGPRPKTQHHGRHRLLTGTTVCDLQKGRPPPPEESTPYPSPSSNAWTQSPKADLQETNQSQTLPGSHSYSSSDPANIFVVTQATQATKSSPVTCAAATFVSLLFTMQKNGVKGESIGHGTTCHTCACAVVAIQRRVVHLRQHGAPPDMHLAAVFNGKRLSTLRSAEITSALRAANKIIGPQVGFTPYDVSTRSMRAGGTMAPLMACVNTAAILLVGRWRSDAMLRYLQKTAQTFTAGLVVCMVQHGD